MSNKSRYWPYEEVKASRTQVAGEFTFSAPWASAKILVDENLLASIESIVDTIEAGDFNQSHLESLSWLFGKLSAYPLAYILPANDPSKKDQYTLKNNFTPDSSGPRELAFNLFSELKTDPAFLLLAKRKQFDRSWLWDLDTALLFSKVSENMYSPETLFTVARRFHLLDSIEDNKTSDLYDFVKSLTNQKFKDASALIVRQNHYVTEQCTRSLSPALDYAQSALDELQGFIRAEKGHNIILEGALKSIGFTPDQLPVVEAVQVLMNLFGLIAKQNFLAFACMVDMFERNSYAKRDPLASLVEYGGLFEAGEKLNLHKDINDKGEHENVALRFLQFMAPVSKEYAVEALQLAELATLVMHQVSLNILEKIIPLL